MPETAGSALAKSRMRKSRTSGSEEGPAPQGASLLDQVA